MVSPILNEHYYDGAFLVSEAMGYRSRESGIVDNSTGSDFLYDAGLVMNQVAAGTDAVVAKAGNTGNGTVGSSSVGATGKYGTYVLTALSPTSFSVTDPSGDALPNATVGTAYTGPLNFTIAAGGTAFVAGDGFTVNVTQQANTWVSWTGGAINRLGILWGRSHVYAGSFKKVAMVVRECEVNAAEVLWDPAVTSNANVATIQATAWAALAGQVVIGR